MRCMPANRKMRFIKVFFSNLGLNQKPFLCNAKKTEVCIMEPCHALLHLEKLDGDAGKQFSDFIYRVASKKQ